VASLQEAQLRSYPLLAREMRKVYDEVDGRASHVAVRSLSLHIRPGEIFGLLGPNGAGKTTFIAMITGLFAPTEGSAWVAGYSVSTEQEKVHLNIGVCPQFDLLWNDLTVEEHLLFYARLKGVVINIYIKILSYLITIT
jgi:ABC-type multidrug transport system ATPase subunit